MNLNKTEMTATFLDRLDSRKNIEDGELRTMNWVLWQIYHKRDEVRTLNILASLRNRKSTDVTNKWDVVWAVPVTYVMKFKFNCVNKMTQDM